MKPDRAAALAIPDLGQGIFRLQPMPENKNRALHDRIIDIRTPTRRPQTTPGQSQ